MERHVCLGFMAILLLGVFCACQSVTEQTLNEEIQDAVITTAVKSRIFTDPVTTLGNVNIETVRNRVYLTGLVSTAAEKTRAHELAMEVPGVVRVVNELQVLEGRNL
ncbi:MAG TPA: BON domain-containing protein [Nitrospirales bacterium]